MKTINLDNIKIDRFFLGNKEYKYLFKQEDKIYYLNSLFKLNPKEDNSEKLTEIFKNILKKQNLKIDITPKDIFGLLNFFNYKFF